MPNYGMFVSVPPIKLVRHIGTLQRRIGPKTTQSYSTLDELDVFFVNPVRVTSNIWFHRKKTHTAFTALPLRQGIEDSTFPEPGFEGGVVGLVFCLVFSSSPKVTNREHQWEGILFDIPFEHHLGKMVYGRCWVPHKSRINDLALE